MILFILAIGFLLWMAIRRAGKMSWASVLEAGLGFLSWFAINTYLSVWGIQSTPGTYFISPFAPIPLLVTIALLLVMSFTWCWIAVGMLAAILANVFGMLLFIAPGPIIDQRPARIEGMIPFLTYYIVPPADH
jgi:hypothetical protein